MIFVRARFTLIGLLVFTLAACDDGAGPEGSPSSFDVFVYVEVDDSTGMGETDEPVSATVTVASNFDDVVRVDSTGADGHVRFEGIAPGAYTVSHVATAAPPGTELTGSAVQTVVAPFAGDDVETRFVYGFEPGTLTGVAFRDDDGSGGFEAGLDTAFAGVAVLVFAGPDTLGTAAASDTTGADGMFDLGELERGEYTILVRPLVGTTVVGGNPRPVTIAAGAATFHEIEFVGDPTGPVVSIQAARAAGEGQMVKVRGVVTAGQGTYRDDSFYLQDGTAGIFVFGVDSALALARGDSVEVIGERSSSREEVQLTASSAVRLGSGTLPEPQVITATDLNAGLFQGELATLSATIDSVGSGFNYTVEAHDATGALIVFVDGDTGIPPAEFTVDAEQTIIGVASVFDADDDGTVEAGEYQLKPRDAADLP